MIDNAIFITWLLMLFALGCAAYRIVIGPSLADRIVALDLLAIVLVSLAMLQAIEQNHTAGIDLALALAIVAFLATVGFARYLRFAEGDKSRQETG